VELFGRAGRAVLSPYEGDHRGTRLQDVLAAYAAVGLAPDPSFRDRPDHVSVELAFLEGLAAREDRAVRRGETEKALAAAKARCDFFRLHVQPWVPTFFDSMGRASFAIHRALATRAAVFLGAAATRRRREASLVEPLCTTCGKPLGFCPPERNGLRTSWGLVCVRCRLRSDLRRFKP
jgi:TorA maturation chaperone TorD